MEDLSATQLVQWVLEGFGAPDRLRLLVSGGGDSTWYSKATEVEGEAGNLAWIIILNHMAGLFGFEIQERSPFSLNQMSKEKLIEAIDGAAVNWLANDGVWFQTVEKQFGMDRLNAATIRGWSRFSPYAASPDKKIIGISLNLRVGRT